MASDIDLGDVLDTFSGCLAAFLASDPSIDTSEGLTITLRSVQSGPAFDGLRQLLPDSEAIVPALERAGCIVAQAGTATLKVATAAVPSPRACRNAGRESGGGRSAAAGGSRAPSLHRRQASVGGAGAAGAAGRGGAPPDDGGRRRMWLQCCGCKSLCAMLSFLMSCLVGVMNFALGFISPASQGAARAWMHGYHGALTTLNATTTEGVAALGRTARVARQWYQQLRSEIGISSGHDDAREPPRPTPTTSPSPTGGGAPGVELPAERSGQAAEQEAAREDARRAGAAEPAAEARTTDATRGAGQELGRTMSSVDAGAAVREPTPGSAEAKRAEREPHTREPRKARPRRHGLCVRELCHLAMLPLADVNSAHDCVRAQLRAHLLDGYNTSSDNFTFVQPAQWRWDDVAVRLSEAVPEANEHEDLQNLVRCASE